MLHNGAVFYYRIFIYLLVLGDEGRLFSSNSKYIERRGVSIFLGNMGEMKMDTRTRATVTAL